MKIFLFAAALLGTATAAPAQPRDGVQTRAETVERVRTMFARVDRDRDGAITAAEAQGVSGSVRQRGLRRAARFDRLDTDRDNMISRNEWNGARAQGEQRGAGLNRRRGGGMGTGMLRRVDANADSRVTLAEAEAAALQRFDRVDRNRDGRITRDERQQRRAQRGGDVRR